MSNWEVVIGLEVHAQVSADSKLFSTAPTAFGAEPNTQVQFLDVGFPGMLPVINGRCVDQAIKTGLGIEGTVQKFSRFDRKNYFYPDLPTGYQISQFYHPIVTDGHIDIDLEDGSTKRIRVQRIHLEQDAGKSTHDINPTQTFLDYNRAGIALMEIVSDPDMSSATEAMAYVKKLRTLVRYLETCDGNMEQGSMRVDANVSIRRPGEPLGTRAEIKNINSIRFLGQAIMYEIERQRDVIEGGGKVVQETRLFDAVRGETRSMRTKEDAHDYRYFPDPDLKPLVLTQERIEAIRAAMPELIDAKKHRFMRDWGLSAYDADILVSEKETAHYYETIVAELPEKHRTAGAKTTANWLISEVFGLMNRENMTLETLPFTATDLARLIALIMDGTLSGKLGKEVFSHMSAGEKPDAVVARLGLQQISDPAVIQEALDGIIAANASQWAELCGGKEAIFGFFVGQIMKQLRGKANPQVVNDLIKERMKG